MSLMRRDQYDPFSNMRRMMDRMRSSLGLSLLPFDEEWPQFPDTDLLAVDMTSDEDNVIVRTALPGVNEDDINIDVRGNVLTISAETKSETEDNDQNWHVREMRYGKVHRSVTLPDEVDIDKANAELENGILKIELPKKESSPAHKIAVKAKKLLKGGKE